MKKIVILTSMGLLAAVGLLLLHFTSPDIVGVAADSSLPPRPMPPSTNGPVLDSGTGESGGFIILTSAQEGTIAKGLWTKVQWKSNGEWVDVDGWEGNFNDQTRVLWWVGSGDLGAGPFRWAVYASENSDKMVSVSNEFFLPTSHMQNIQVNVPLPMETTVPKDSTPNTATSKVYTTDLLRGGFIILTMSEDGVPMVASESDYWTKVQWKSGDVWVDVNGWQGEFTSDAEVAWWVADENLGDGPFRWVVYKDGRVLITSDAFMLPATRNEDVWVQVDVK